MQEHRKKTPSPDVVNRHPLQTESPSKSGLAAPPQVGTANFATHTGVEALPKVERINMIEKN